MFNERRNNLNLSILGLLLLYFTIDLVSEHFYRNKISDTIVIHAPPEKVWPHVVAYEQIDADPEFWLFNIGMPRPQKTTVDGYRKGAGRKCIFNEKVVFDETMVVFEPPKNLTFDVIRQPEDPEIIGHIRVERGQFILKDNGDGTTTLTGNSWYRLNVFPAWYYDLWATSITRNVHLRVMEHIKLLSEAHPG